VEENKGRRNISTAERKKIGTGKQRVPYCGLGIIFDGHGKDAADGLAESFDEIVIVAAAAFLARN